MSYLNIFFFENMNTNKLIFCKFGRALQIIKKKISLSNFFFLYSSKSQENNPEGNITSLHLKEYMYNNNI